MRALKITAIVLISVLGFCIAYYSYWNYQWTRAETDASRFCASATVGSGIADVIAQAKAAGKRVSDGLLEGQSYYAVVFPGPIFNAFTCELIAVDGKVTSRRVIEPKD